MGVKLNKLKPFRILYQKPIPGKILPRYEQNGKLFTCGGILLEDYLKAQATVIPFVAPEVLQCPHCEKTYKEQQWLDRHIKKHHEANE